MNNVNTKNDTISRLEAIEAICKSECGGKFCGIPCPEVNALKALPSVEAIPVEWINGRIANLMEMDNAFASLTANLIRTLLNNWRAEQNEG